MFSAPKKYYIIQMAYVPKTQIRHLAVHSLYLDDPNDWNGTLYTKESDAYAELEIYLLGKQQEELHNLRLERAKKGIDFLESPENILERRNPSLRHDRWKELSEARETFIKNKLAQERSDGYEETLD